MYLWRYLFISVLVTTGVLVSTGGTTGATVASSAAHAGATPSVSIKAFSISHYDASARHYVDTNVVKPHEDVDFDAQVLVIDGASYFPAASITFIRNGQVLDTETIGSGSPPTLQDQNFFLGMPLDQSFAGNLIVRFSLTVGPTTVSTDRALAVLGKVPTGPKSPIDIHVYFTHNPVYRGKPNIVFLETQSMANVALSVTYPDGTGWKATGKTSSPLGYWNHWFKASAQRPGTAALRFTVTWKGNVRHYTAHLSIL